MDILLGIISIIGVVSFAAAGAMVAIEKETDIFGVLFLSIVTTFGGGILRDVIVGEGIPLFFGMHLEIVITVITALTVFTVAKLFSRQYVAEKETVVRINNVLDALGLGIFASAGTELCLHLGPLVAITMGLFSSVGGSLTRDVILRDIPFILRKRVYAVAVILGSSLYYTISEFIMKGSGSREAVATVACTVLIVTVRMCATHYKWNLPKAIIFDTKVEDARNIRPSDSKR